MNKEICQMSSAHVLDNLNHLFTGTLDLTSVINATF